jgi:hypothetical protein
MTFLDDLNSTTWAFTFVTLALCALFAFSRNRTWWDVQPIIGRLRLVLLLSGVCWSGIMGLSTLENASDARHGTVTGPLDVVGYTYAGRGTHINRYLAHVEGAMAHNITLVMEPRAQAVLTKQKRLSGFTVGYLADPMMVRPDVFAFKVVDISNPETGASYYHIDTARHAVRAGFFFADGVLFAALFMLAIRVRTHPPETRMMDSAN